MTASAQEPAISSEVAGSVVVDTDHGPLKLPAAMYALWQRHGWPGDDVLAEMVADGRWRP